MIDAISLWDYVMIILMSLDYLYFLIIRLCRTFCWVVMNISDHQTSIQEYFCFLFLILGVRWRINLKKPGRLEIFFLFAVRRKKSCVL